MENKHPAPRDEDMAQRPHLRVVSGAAVLQMDTETVGKSVRSFARGSAGGPSGLKPQHLKDALVPGWRDVVLRQLTAVASDGSHQGRQQLPLGQRVQHAYYLRVARLLHLVSHQHLMFASKSLN